MGFINENITESARQLNEISANTQLCIDAIRFSLATLEAQRYAMETNSEYTQEDIEELNVLINNLKQQINNI
jgi:hypothetical protein